MSALPERIEAYILKKGEVSLTELREKAKGKYTSVEMQKAMRAIHKSPRIKKVIRAEEVFYRKQEEQKPKKQTLSTTYWKTISADERAAMRKESEEFWEHSPLVTDEERECYRQGWKSEECQLLLMTPAEKELYMQHKHGPAWKHIKERDRIKELGLL